MSNPRIVIYLHPEEARNSGAAWKIQGLTDWETHYEWVELQTGETYTIEFKEVEGLITPGTQTFPNLKEGMEFSTVGTYTRDEEHEEEWPTDPAQPITRYPISGVTPYYAWIENDGKVYVGIGRPSNWVLVSEEGQGNNRIRIKVIGGMVYLAWIRYESDWRNKPSEFGHHVYYAMMTLEGTGIYVNSFRENLGMRTGRKRIDFTVVKGYMHLIWDTSPFRGVSNIYTATIRLPVFVDMNPAHILRECLTNAIWGMSYPIEDLDDDSFTHAANVLYNEGFGLSFIWDRADEIQSVINEVIRHIDAFLYVDIRTGKFTLKLLRDDYNPDSLEVVGPDRILKMVNFAKRAKNELINTVTLNYHNAVIDEEATITLHDLSLLSSQGHQIGKDLNFKYISNADLANRVAARELRNASAELIGGSMLCNRECSHFTIGDVFKLQWPDYGVDSVIVRVSNVSYGVLNNNEVLIEFFQDIAGLEESVYIVSDRTRPPREITQPIYTTFPQRPPYAKLEEIPYYVLTKYLQDSEIAWNEIDEMSGFINYGVARPQKEAIGFQFFTAAGEMYNMRANGLRNFTPTGLIEDFLPASEEETIIKVKQLISRYKIKGGTYAMIGNEVVSIEEINIDQTFKIKRGVLDTIPQAHFENTRIWFFGSVINTDYRAYMTGEAAHALGCTQLKDSMLPQPLGVYDMIIISNRFIRPYPPGKFRIDGEYRPINITEDLGTITWEHRNRLEQGTTFVDQNEEGIDPEEGTTYTVRIYDENGNLIREETELTDTSFEYTREMEEEDSELVVTGYYIGETTHTHFGARYE